jgi:catechol 2,3-dioxygenase-like lactoylglutathione lyase family enzyme
MKRLHVHIHVEDLGESIAFYRALFGAEPVVEKTDYAKWLLDDPAVNFAISARGGESGISHLGFQLDDGEELAALTGRLREAGRGTLDQTDAKCCYARSDKAWASDPQGVAWENFVSHGALESFGEDLEPERSGAAVSTTR